MTTKRFIILIGSVLILAFSIFAHYFVGYRQAYLDGYYRGMVECDEMLQDLNNNSEK